MYIDQPLPGFRPLRGDALDDALYRLRTVRHLSICGPPFVGKHCLARELGRSLSDRGACVWYVRGQDAEGLEQALTRFREVCKVPPARPDLVVYAPATGRAPAAEVATLRGLGASSVLIAEAPAGVAGETVFELAPLAVGGVQSPSTRLLVEEVTARRGEAPDGDEVRALTRLATRVGGLPLALIGAANALRTLDARDVLASWRRDGDALWQAVDPTRQIGARIEESLGRLEGELVEALAALSIVEGHFGIETAEALVPERTTLVLHQLHQFGLISVARGEEGRVEYVVPGYFGALAARRLDPARRHALGRLHAEHFREVAVRWLGQANDGVPSARLRLEGARPDLLAATERVARWREEADQADRPVPPADLDLELVLRACEGNARVRGKLDAALADDLAALLERSDGASGIDPEARARALLALAFERGRQGITLERIELLERALESARQADDMRLRGVCAHNLAIDAWRSDDREGARRYGDMAVESFEKCDNQRALGRIIELQGLMLHDEGRLGDAEHAFQRALDLFRRSGARSHEGIVLLHIGVLQMTRGRWCLSRSTLQDALAINADQGEPIMEALSHVALGVNASWFGAPEELDRELAISDSVIDAHLDSDAKAVAQYISAGAMLLVDQPGRAEATVRESLSTLEATANLRKRAEALGVLGLSLWFQGRPDDAVEFLVRAARKNRAVSCWRRAAIDDARLAAVRSQLGARAEADADLARAREAAAAVPDPTLGPILDAWAACGGLVPIERLAALWLAGGRAESEGERYFEVSLATALYLAREDAALREALAREHDGRTNVVGPGGAWVITAGGDPVDLASRPQLAALVHGLALLRRRESGAWLERESIRALLWPGEAMSEASLSNRIHKTLSVLRREGLADELEGQGSGYRFSPEAPLSLLPPRVRPSK